MRYIAALFVGLVLGATFAGMALVVRGLMPLALAAMPANVESARRLIPVLVYSILCVSGLVTVITPVLFIRARITEYRASHNGVWLGKEQLHYKDWRD